MAPRTSIVRNNAVVASRHTSISTGYRKRIRPVIDDGATAVDRLTPGDTQPGRSPRSESTF